MLCTSNFISRARAKTAAICDETYSFFVSKASSFGIRRNDKNKENDEWAEQFFWIMKSKAQISFMDATSISIPQEKK